MNPYEECYNKTDIRIAHLNLLYTANCIPDSLKVLGINRAVLEGDLLKVKQWIELGECVNEREDLYVFSALHLAVIRNDMEILEYLLSRADIEVDARCSSGKTPLYLATALGWIELVKKLIQAGSNVNARALGNDTPLHMSVHHPRICHLLIQHGAIIDAADSMGHTPLSYATECGCMETIHMLLYYNADANVIDKNDYSCFITALIFGKIDAQEALLDYVDDFNRISHDRVWFGSILSFALRTSSPFVKDIIERGADVNYGDDPRIQVEDCAFSACLRYSVDLSTFKMVWERLRYNDFKNTIDLLGFLDYTDKVPTFLNVIIESDNFETVVQFFSKGEHYFLFVNKFAERKFDLDQLMVLTCRLLEHGYRASSYDIHAIFYHYGYCELFRILLYMDNDLIRGWLPRMTIPRLMFDIHFDFESVIDIVNDIPMKTVLQLLEYTACPRLIGALTFRFNGDRSMSAILSSLPRVPSLVELARNVARIQIRRSFRVTNTCQFYTAIDHLDIAHCKDILTFKGKIYTVSNGMFQ